MYLLHLQKLLLNYFLLVLQFLLPQIHHLRWILSLYYDLTENREKALCSLLTLLKHKKNKIQTELRKRRWSISSPISPLGNWWKCRKQKECWHRWSPIWNSCRGACGVWHWDRSWPGMGTTLKWHPGLTGWTRCWAGCSGFVLPAILGGGHSIYFHGQRCQ